MKFADVPLVPALLLVAAATLAPPVDAAPNPCAMVDRSLTDEQARRLAPVVAKHLTSPSPAVEGIVVFDPSVELGVRVIGSFKFHDWQILHIDLRVAEPGFLFYKREPSKGKFVGVWGGTVGYDHDDPAAAPGEQRKLKAYLDRKLRGIPANLSRCFAWHVVVEVWSDAKP